MAIRKYKPVEIDPSDSVKDTALNTARMVVAAGGGSAVGAMFGALSIPVGIVATAYGVHKGKADGLAFGLGMITGGAYKSGNELMSGMEGPEDMYGVEGMDGFNIQNMIKGAQQRLKNWFAINKSRVIPIKSSTGMPPQKGKVGSLFMDGFGETALLGDEFVGSAEELMGDTTEMTISSIGNVRINPDGNMMLGLNSVGGFL